MGLGLTGAFGAAGAIQGLRAIEARAIEEQQRQAKAAQQEFLNKIALQELQNELDNSATNRTVAIGGLDLRKGADKREGVRFDWEGQDRGEKRAVMGGLKEINPSAYNSAVSGVPEDAWLTEEMKMDRAIAGGRRQGAAGQAAFDAGGRSVLEQTEGPKGIRTMGELRLIGARSAADLERARITAQNKPPTGAQQDNLKFYRRMSDAMTTLNKLDDKVTDTDLVLINDAPEDWTPEWLRNIGLSAAGKQYLQALRTYTESRLRDESGAAIGTGEYVNDRRMIGRARNDDPDTLAQKRRSRAITAEGLAFGSGRAFEDYFGRPFTPGELVNQLESGKKTVTTAQVEAIAKRRGTTVEQEKARAAAEGFTIIR
jgi:hypothetical protein